MAVKPLPAPMSGYVQFSVMRKERKGLKRPRFTPKVKALVKKKKKWATERKMKKGGK